MIKYQYGYLSFVFLAVVAASLMNSQIALAAPSVTVISGDGSGSPLISCDLLRGGNMQFHATKQGNKIDGTVTATTVSPVDATVYSVHTGHFTEIKTTKNGYVLKGVFDTDTDYYFGTLQGPYYPRGLCNYSGSDTFTISGNYGTGIPISLKSSSSAGTFTGTLTGTVTKS